VSGVRQKHGSYLVRIAPRVTPRIGTVQRVADKQMRRWNLRSTQPRLPFCLPAFESISNRLDCNRLFGSTSPISVVASMGGGRRLPGLSQTAALMRFGAVLGHSTILPVLRQSFRPSPVPTPPVKASPGAAHQIDHFGFPAALASQIDRTLCVHGRCWCQ
jgi:hypothetical protein